MRLDAEMRQRPGVCNRGAQRAPLPRCCGIYHRHLAVSAIGAALLTDPADAPFSCCKFDFGPNVILLGFRDLQDEANGTRAIK